jgi:hypothetical protein
LIWLYSKKGKKELQEVKEGRKERKREVETSNIWAKKVKDMTN